MVSLEFECSQTRSIEAPSISKAYSFYNETPSISKAYSFPFDLICLNKRLDVTNPCYIEPISVSLEWSVQRGPTVFQFQKNKLDTL